MVIKITVNLNEFQKLPILVIHDSVILDILGENKTSSYRESAIFITNYFLQRQALMGLGAQKSAITSPQVFSLFETENSKYNTITSLRDWIEEDYFTRPLEHLGPRTSIYVLAHIKARRTLYEKNERVILISNDKNIDKKLLYFYKQSNFNFNSINELPFAVMNTDQLKELIKQIDSNFFEIIKSIIE